MRAFLAQDGHFVLGFAPVIPFEQTFEGLYPLVLVDCSVFIDFVAFNDSCDTRDVVLPESEWRGPFCAVGF